ncbi:hypothetical protein [Acinetobacter sp. YH12021]|uniref:hypothetical protein n=1 Tax=Acinetobacter sp. YH12021 TaxID=2601040 RepID=UPI0015D30F6A|nr:hypothetical protein [Acinetobacter sp. YH12021]
MSNKDFLKEIIELYKIQQNSKNISENIIRGRSKSIAGEAEEIFAKFIESNNCRDCMYYIDQPIQFGSTKRICYPDIFILENTGVISHLIDIKMDIGWKRNEIFDFCSSLDRDVKNIQGIETQFSIKIEKSKKQRISATFSQDLKYHVVILSKKNSKVDVLEEHHKRVNNELNSVDLYMLSDGVYLNDYDNIDTILGKLIVLDGEFQRFFNAIRQI